MLSLFDFLNNLSFDSPFLSPFGPLFCPLLVPFRSPFCLKSGPLLVPFLNILGPLLNWAQCIWKLIIRNGPNIGEGQSLVAPVFLLFLDCVFQIHTQFPCSFEFSPGLLVVLADHSSSSNFGTFLWDCEKDRRDGRVREQTVSLWSFLNQVEILSQHLKIAGEISQSRWRSCPST